MGRPKTYGEYADQTPDVHVDSRVRDREITDDAWMMLHMEDELRPEIVQRLKVTEGRRTYVDYYDDNNVVLTTSTTHPASLMLSGIVGDRCDVRYRYSDGHAGKYHTAKSMNVLFENLNRRAMTDIRVNDLGKDDHRFYDTPIDTNIMHERIRRQIQLRAEQLPQAQLNKDTHGGPYMTKGFEWTAANGDMLSRVFHVRLMVMTFISVAPIRLRTRIRQKLYHSKSNTRQSTKVPMFIRQKMHSKTNFPMWDARLTDG